MVSVFILQAPLDPRMLYPDGPHTLAILQQSSSPAPAAPATTTTAPPLAGQGTAAPGGTAGQGAAPTSMFGGDMMFILLPVILVLILLTVLGPRKEQKRRNSMLKAMKKHDRVQTVGGVIGSITEIKSDTIVLKVDETSNTRMTFTRDAVQQILETESAS